MLITTFQTTNNYYVYSAWTNEIARISKELYNLFNNAEESEKRRKGIELGLLPIAPIPVDVFSDERIGEAVSELMEQGPETLILSVTDQCNFRCRYCQFSGAYPQSRVHSNKKMTSELAVQAIDWCANFLRTKRHIGFYGGEPFLRFSLLKEVIRHALSTFKGETSFGITTNGSLLDVEAMDFLEEFNVHLFVSLDGPAIVNDRYRLDSSGRPTFNVVWDNLQKLQNRHPAYYSKYVGFNVTAAPPDQLPLVVRFFEENPSFFKDKLFNISNIKQGSDEIFQRLEVKEPGSQINYQWAWEAFLSACIHNERPPDYTRKICEPPMARIHHREMGAQVSFTTDAGQCEPGLRCHVMTDGTLHMCEHIDPIFPLGRLPSGFDYDSIRTCLRMFREIINVHCQDCWAIQLCSKCIPHIVDGTSLSLTNLSSLCNVIKKRLKRDFAHYCESREKNLDCFEWIANKTYDVNI